MAADAGRHILADSRVTCYRWKLKPYDQMSQLHQSSDEAFAEILRDFALLGLRPPNAPQASQDVAAIVSTVGSSQDATSASRGSSSPFPAEPFTAAVGDPSSRNSAESPAVHQPIHGRSDGGVAAQSHDSATQHARSTSPWALIGGVVAIGAAALLAVWQTSQDAPTPSNRVDTVVVLTKEGPPVQPPGRPPRRENPKRGSSSRSDNTPVRPPPNSTPSTRGHDTSPPGGPPLGATPASASIEAAQPEPDPYLGIESRLREASRFMGSNSPGRAYHAASEAIDKIAVLQTRSDLDAARLEGLKTRAERLSTAALKQCDNTTDPNTIRTQCP